MKVESKTKDVVVSGSKPTGDLHIGSYFGTIRQWVELQHESEYRCHFFVADYHALTENTKNVDLRPQTLAMAADLLACGIDPKKAVLFVQSDVPEHTELAWILNCLTGVGDLERMTQFKDRRQRLGAGELNVGLLDYPVLQSADILIYHATKVPVGEDQLQHLELCRRIARRFNKRYGFYFQDPQPLLSDACRIMSLTNPLRKMSKSDGEKQTIRISDSAEVVWEKIRAAVTDAGAEQPAMSPGVRNLFVLLRLVAPEPVYQEFTKQHASRTIRYERLKRVLFEHLSEILKPIRERRTRLRETDVKSTLESGASQARRIARETLRDVRERVGLG